MLINVRHQQSAHVGVSILEPLVMKTFVALKGERIIKMLRFTFTLNIMKNVVTKE